MTRFFIFLGFFLLSAVASADGRQDPVSTHDRLTNGGVTSYRLANGFKVVLVPYPSAGEAKASLVVRSGSKVEGYGETGMAHLLEHMIFMGAGQRKSVKEDLTKLNASWNGTTSPDRTNYFATVPADQARLEEVIRILADMFIDPRFTEDDLRREMTVVRNEMEIRENSAVSLAMDAMKRQSFFWHGYGRTTIGARSDVENAPFYALKDFHRRHYRPDNAFLLVAGVFDEAATTALINRLFSRAVNPSTPPPPTWTREAVRPLNSVSEVFLPSGNTMALSAWKLPPAVNRETTAFQLAAAALCSEEWGVLRRRLVLERKVATSASCGTDTMNDATVFVATATGSQEGDPEVMRAELVATLGAAAAKGITRDDLERARIEALNHAERTTRSMESFASSLEDAESAGDWRYFFTDWDITKQIGFDEANAALRKWITAYGRSDVLVRHRDKVELPALPEIEAIGPLAQGRIWSPVAGPVDRKPTSLDEFRAAVQDIHLGDEGARGALIQRRTQGDRVWLRLVNRYGNPAYMRDNHLACALVSQLFDFGGAGLDHSALDARMEALDAQWTLSLSGLMVSTKRANLDAALDTLTRVWVDPYLPEGEFSRIKQQWMTAIDQNLTSPSAVANKQLSFRFDNYPEGHPGKPKSFERLREERQAVTYEQVKACAENLRGLSDYFLVVTGDLDRQEFLRLWETRFKALPKAKVAYERVMAPRAPEKVDTSDIVVAMPHKPNATITAFGSLPLIMTDPDFPALRLAFMALGDDSNSRLFQRLREREGLSYSVSAGLDGNPRDPRSSWSISASVASPDYPKAMSALRDELAKVLREGFSEEEIAAVRSAWIDKRKETFASEKGYAGFVADLLRDGVSIDFLIGYDRRIATLTAKDVTEVFRKHISAERMVWAVGVGSQ